jgi:hypothetical protein
MTADSPTKPIRTDGYQQPKSRVFPMVLSALLATQVFIEDARAETSPRVMLAANLNSSPPSLGATPKKERLKKERSSNSNAAGRSCWQYKYRQGRWKRTNVCFSGSR